MQILVLATMVIALGFYLSFIVILLMLFSTILEFELNLDLEKLVIGFYFGLVIICGFLLIIFAGITSNRLRSILRAKEEGVLLG